MKYCPHCQTRYTDDTLRFCLQDGTPLAAETSADAAPTVAFSDPAQLNETETIVAPRAADFTPVERRAVDSSAAVAPRSVEPIRIDVASAPESAPHLPPGAPAQTVAAPPRRSKTLPLVLLTALAALALVGAGAWLLMKNNRAETAKAPANSAGNQTSAANANVKANVKNTPAPTASPKSETNAANVAAANANVNASPAPNIDREQIKEEVADRVGEWTSLTESRDLGAYMNYYAETVDYYNKRGASAAAVRSDKQRAFSAFDSIEMNISNLIVTPDASGERATAVFDKEWFFEGAEKSSSGKVKSELQLRKINGRWLITSERDLKVYYTE